MNHHAQIESLLRSIGGPQLLQTLGQYAEQAGDAMNELGKHRRAAAFSNVGQLLAEATRLLVEAEEPNREGRVQGLADVASVMARGDAG